MKIYNSLTRKKEEFIPRNKDLVTMYTCGPTVYHYAHLGNFRTYIVQDILERTLNFIGYKVKRAMNITDIGHLSGDIDTGKDKMLESAKREHKSIMEIAQFYTNEFKRDCDRLNIKWPEIVVPATSCVDRYIEMIDVLIKKGYAYFSEGNVYFDTSKLDEYYTLTNHNSEDLLVGVRDSVEEDLGKKNKTDFVLWFTKSKFDDQELKWNSPWGYGYPGWHIECSGISTKYLGEYLDIHCGGVDNKFPHHTNEIAQSEGFLGHEWCHYWFHVEHLNDERGKMSKSSGDFLVLDKIVKSGYSPLVYRLFCLQSHWQKPLVFSFDRLDGSLATYNKLKDKVASLLKEEDKVVDSQIVDKYMKDFKDALEDNLNTSMALTVLYNVLKDNISAGSKLALIEEFEKVLALDLLKGPREEISKEVSDLAEARWQAKLNKDWTKADELRNELTKLGYAVKDSKDGYEISKI